MEQRINRNIPLLFLIKVCQWFMLYMPVVKLFYVENNLKDFDLFFLHAIYSAVIFLTEIPSGYIADVWGRKKSMQLGLFMGLLGFGAHAPSVLGALLVYRGFYYLLPLIISAILMALYEFIPGRRN